MPFALRSSPDQPSPPADSAAPEFGTSAAAERRPGASQSAHARSPRLTHVIVPGYPLTDFLFAGLQPASDVNAIRHPMRRSRPGPNLLRALEVYLLPWMKHSFYFDRDYVEQLRRIGPDDVVVFFAVENRKDLQIMRKFLATRRQVVWLWNPIKNYRGGPLSRLWYLHWLRRSGVRAYTFDPSDARARGIGLAPQVYRHLPVGDEPGAIVAPALQDVYFLGLDKGRLDELRSLRSTLEGAGLTTHFHVLADRRRRYDEAERACLATEWLTYQDNLHNVARSRAVLELLQSCQSGPTIRSMEALFLNKKLITNNLALRETSFYHPSRIFLLGQDDIAGIRQFIESPLEPVDEAALRPHEIEHWIRQFRD